MARVGDMVKYIKRTKYRLVHMPDNHMIGIVSAVGIPWSGRLEELKYHGGDIRKSRIYEVWWIELERACAVPERNLEKISQ